MGVFSRHIYTFLMSLSLFDDFSRNKVVLAQGAIGKASGRPTQAEAPIRRKRLGTEGSGTASARALADLGNWMPLVRILLVALRG